MIEQLLVSYALLVAGCTLALICWVVVKHKQSKKRPHEYFLSEDEWKK